jgi:hypothetical protein
MWLERCLGANAFVSPEIHVTSTPFPHMPLKGELHPGITTDPYIDK